jgi:hypothetical protein
MMGSIDAIKMVKVYKRVHKGIRSQEGKKRDSSLASTSFQHCCHNF